MSDRTVSSAADDDSDEMEWEEVDLAAAEEARRLKDATVALDAPGTIEFTIPLEKGKGKEKAGPKIKVMSAAERAARLNSHKIHTVALIVSAGIRNRWANDGLLHARLMSLVPLSIQNSLSMITKKQIPDTAKRGRLFEAAISRLCEWWCDSFDVIPDIGVKGRTFDQVRNGAEVKGEVLRSEKSMMKHALQMQGSTDVSAQLFTALCRALAVPARLVVSVQSVPWQAGVGKKSTKKAKGTPKKTTEEEDDDDMEEVPIPGPSTQKPDTKPAVKLRNRTSKGNRLRDSSAPAPPLAGWPPVFWTEVFSRPDGRWIPVDPIRNLINKKKLFEPPRNAPDNRMTYVVAFEEDGYLRDVTLRYKSTVRTAKLRGGKAHQEWWDQRVLRPLTRPYRLHRDDVEDEELHAAQMIEGMPNSVAGFKDHPIYVLERHLHRDEVLHPRIEVGKFRGEPVFGRSNVLTLKTSENWMRQGRAIVAGAQPLKHVPMRAVTIHRKREIESQEGDVLQGMYAFHQTEMYVPPPVVEGKVPKNDFGNIDLYVPSMLPAGAVHIAHKGTNKIARQLGIDFAEAVVGFEFKNRRALPILSGIVIAAEQEDRFLEAYWASVADSEEKERAKRLDRVLKRWTRLIHGLRIRDRLQAEYGRKDGEAEKVPEDVDEHHAGGFVTRLDETIQHFSLPKMQHVVVENAMENQTTASTAKEEDSGFQFVMEDDANAATSADDDDLLGRLNDAEILEELGQSRRAKEDLVSQRRRQATRTTKEIQREQKPATSGRSQRTRRAAVLNSQVQVRGKKRGRRRDDGDDEDEAQSSDDGDDGDDDADFTASGSRTSKRTAASTASAGARVLRSRVRKSYVQADSEDDEV